LHLIIVVVFVVFHCKYIDSFYLSSPRQLDSYARTILQSVQFKT